MNEATHRLHSLASCYENTLTTIVRLGTLAPAELPNAQNLRDSIKLALKNSLEQGKAMGHANEANQTAFFAVVAFVDESVLRLQNPAFAAWAQRPLQEELFGHNRAGEVFFEHLDRLLSKPDSQEVADAAEVFALCLLLGFRGRYAMRGADSSFFQGNEPAVARSSGEIDRLVRQIREKIARIRGQALFLQAEAPPPEVKQVSKVDPWSRGLGIAAASLFLLVLLSWVSFWLTLSGPASHTL